MFYHWWIYTHVINTEWFNWSLVWIVLTLNFVMPVIIWFTMSSRFPFVRSKKEDDKISPPE